MRKLLQILLDSRLQLCFFAILAICLQAFIWIVSPVNGPVVLYKLGLPILAAIAGLFCDVAFFPYARPDSYLREDWKEDPDADNTDDADYPIAKEYKSVFNLACLRRAVIIAAFVLAVSLGL